MTAIYMNSSKTDQERRELLYQGDLFVYSASPSTAALCDLARELSEEAFAPHDPRQAQYDMSQEDYVAILADLKPKFIHHPRAKQLIPAILAELGCVLEKTYFDVPRLRTVTSDEFLTSGLGYAFKPHRDTWYSPPMCQLNWWLPVYEIVPENAMAFHPVHWHKPVLNSSAEFNYQDWQDTGRKDAATFVKADTRKQSEALEPVQLEPDLRVIAEPGGLLIFSAAQLHSTVPNTSGCTRLSIDFRTVNLDDLRNTHGAHNIDSACSGTTIRDYLRGTDQAHLPEPLCQLYEQVTAPEAGSADAPVVFPFQHFEQETTN
jgi:hypothetical protein